MRGTSAKHILISVIVLVIGLITVRRSPAQTFSVIHSFTGGADGANPLAGFMIDGLGNLYGTATQGGKFGAGVVLKINRRGHVIALYSFHGGSDGAYPSASLVRDASGSLYGTTAAGGAYGAGVVFKVPGKGLETVLYSFKGGADGANPAARLAKDLAGNLYGTTTAGGTYNGGTVFKLSPAGQETVLYSFGHGADGAIPIAGVTIDGTGKLYGTTSVGGAYGNGTVFQLTPSNPTWTENILHHFGMGNDGGILYSGLVLDGAGNLYGAATDGGNGGENGGGTIFELTPSGGGWTFTVLYGLPGWGISGSFRDLLLDASGNIYATTHCDGNDVAGTVYKLTRSGGIWTYTLLYTFTGGSDGLYSFSNLVADKQGNLYGTTNVGGTNGYGVVFKVKP
jgi:uncharacterized repeat protein (TIGR03803 family)